MALITKQDRRISPPHEPESWFTVTVPLDAGDLADMGDAGNLAQVKIAGVTKALKAWSFPEPVSVDNIRRLDVATFNWLTTQIFEASTLSDDEKNASGANSSATTAQETAPSLASSGI